MARRLGINQRFIPSLITHGVFGQDSSGGRNYNSCVKWFVTEVQMVDFEERMKSIFADAVPTLDARSWPSFHASYRPKSIDFADVIGAVRSGRVRVAEGEVHRMSKILFYEDDLVRLMKAGPREPELSAEAA